MAAEPICIRRTTTMEEAEIVAAWLADHGVEATIVDRNNPGTFAFGMTDLEGVALYVADQAAADQAETLLQEHDREREARLAAMGPLTAVCDECGQRTQYPPAMAGTVQECGVCKAYVDVPGGPDE